MLSAEATAPDHPAHEYFVGRYEFTRDEYPRRHSRALAAEGRLLEGVTPQRAAVATIAMMDGLQVQWLLDRDVIDMAEELKTFFSSFVDIEFDGEPLRTDAESPTAYPDR